MTDREYEKGIASIIKDFRNKELTQPLDSNHVHKWVLQFEPEDRSAILKETFFVLSKYYIKEHEINDFLKKILHCCDDLSRFVFMHVQEDGDSQTRLYSKIADLSEGKALFYKSPEDKSYLNSQYKFVYIDDGLFTGRRARNDLGKVIDLLPEQASLYVFYLIAFSNGLDYTRNYIRKKAKSKNINVNCHVEHILNNNRDIKNAKIDIVWPKAEEFQSLQNVKHYYYCIKKRMEERGKHAYYVFNQNNVECTLFEAKTSGSVVERAFTERGVEIYNNLNMQTWQPLGKEHKDSLGFGAFIATDLNVPNNAPLVLWWGSISPDDKWGWYPLLPRRGNDQIYNEVKVYNKRYSLSSYRRNLKDILVIVRSLTTEKEQKYLQEHKKEESIQIGDKIDMIWADILQNRGCNLLENYLTKQDIDTIKIVETIMYIGRDYVPEVGESFPVANPDRLIKDWMRDLGADDWNSKENEIGVIMSKLPAGQYLSRAFHILGIEM